MLRRCYTYCGSHSSGLVLAVRCLAVRPGDSWHRPADTQPRGHPLGTPPQPPDPPPSLKASGELQEKVPRVYAHMRRAASERSLAGARQGADYVEAPAARRLVCVSAFTQSLPTYICIVTLYGNNVCDHSLTYRPTPTPSNRLPGASFDSPGRAPPI